MALFCYKFYRDDVSQVKFNNFLFTNVSKTVILRKTEVLL